MNKNKSKKFIVSLKKINLFLIILFAGLFSFFMFSCDKNENYIFVQTEEGQIKGKKISNISTFKGVPYATANRFETPEKTPMRSETLDCVEYGPIVPQTNDGYHNDKNKKYYDESKCLNLNI
jgi:para-nitrobenzyl esterase